MDGDVYFDLAVFKDDDAVGVADGGQAMSHDDSGASLTRFVQRLLHHRLALGVQRRRGFVQQEDLGIAHQGSGDGDALLLATAELGAALSDLRLKKKTTQYLIIASRDINLTA